MAELSPRRQVGLQSEVAYRGPFVVTARARASLTMQRGVTKRENSETTGDVKKQRFYKPFSNAYTYELFKSNCLELGGQIYRDFAMLPPPVPHVWEAACKVPRT